MKVIKTTNYTTKGLKILDNALVQALGQMCYEIEPGTPCEDCEYRKLCQNVGYAHNRLSKTIREREEKKPMRYTDREIYENLVTFVICTRQDRLQDVINYAMGYYGVIDNQICSQIRELIKEGTIINL